MSVNKLFLAAAGCGKTTYIINEALKLKNHNILITTYTDNNERSIKKKILEINGTIPKNIKVQTWFSFLIKHGVKPYITCLTKNINDVKGLIFDQHKHNSKIDRSKSEYYFSKTNKIYSESLAEFVFNCNYISDNKVINRLENIFDIIFIDEVQDISGYDLEIIRLLFNSSINVYLVGDLRQRIYQTNNALKNSTKKNNSNKNYSINIYEYIIKNKGLLNCDIDNTTFNISYRNNREICDFASKLYKEFGKVSSHSQYSDSHEGIYFINEKEVNKYLEMYPNNIVQLRYSKKSANSLVNTKYPIMNFGAVKGLEYDRVIIFLTSGLMDILKDNDIVEYSDNKSKLYVAITRARHSVVFVTDEDLTEYGIKKFNFV
ncbi:hypothetical protein BHAMNSH16_11055 [Brachyspira hampsonii]|uniref:DNA 3'-5' helicase II n=2 Tax=Brachyspira hampsonii TaxID=1287055 RepID=A0AAC9TUH5_9SPIR|nr:UvrD-helicase domain-containing protein [Brachyspira hampsonii]ASJ22141.1 hypothetical protein BHAMNSH16_11055 [Brachyspira hampsonii]OEJ15125.1 hypothetical protein A9496_13875 [Brachyspira hampsonii]